MYCVSRIICWEYLVSNKSLSHQQQSSTKGLIWKSLFCCLISNPERGGWVGTILWSTLHSDNGDGRQDYGLRQKSHNKGSNNSQCKALITRCVRDCAEHFRGPHRRLPAAALTSFKRIHMVEQRRVVFALASNRICWLTSFCSSNAFKDFSSATGYMQVIHTYEQ